MTARLDSKNPFVDNLARLHQIVRLHLQGCSKSCWGTTGRRCIMLGGTGRRCRCWEPCSDSRWRYPLRHVLLMGWWQGTRTWKILDTWWCVQRKLRNSFNAIGTYTYPLRATGKYHHFRWIAFLYPLIMCYRRATAVSWWQKW